jgi:cytochrome c5
MRSAILLSAVLTAYGGSVAVAAAAAPAVASATTTTALNANAHAALTASAETLLRDSKCAGCHAAKFATAADKTGDAVYTRKNRSVTSYAKLVVQVARCDTELNLQVFEDDQAIISRYLNTRFYKFQETGKN